MKRPNLEQDYIFDRSKGDYLHHETKQSYDSDLEAYVDYLEALVKNYSIPDVVWQSEQLKCHHQYMNAGTLQGEAMKKCLKCGDYVKAL
jgi:hypothetical protein